MILSVIQGANHDILTNKYHTLGNHYLDPQHLVRHYASLALSMKIRQARRRPFLSFGIPEARGQVTHSVAETLAVNFSTTIGTTISTGSHNVYIMEFHALPSVGKSVNSGRFIYTFEARQRHTEGSLESRLKRYNRLIMAQRPKFLLSPNIHHGPPGGQQEKTYPKAQMLFSATGT
jgi:hypothetical protein